MLKIIFYILLAAVLLYLKSQKDNKNKRTKPYAQPGDGRKDDEFSLEELMRRIKPEQMEPAKPAGTIPERTTNRRLEKTDDKLPFEKRRPLEKTELKEARSREKTPQIVVYDENGTSLAKAHEHNAHRLVADSGNIGFHFNSEEAEVHDWFDARQAIIYQEILRRPDY